MKTSEARISDALFNGLLVDISKAEQMYLIAQTIGEYSKAIKSSDHWAMLGLWQIICSNEHTMAAARMFDNPSKHNNVRSVCVVLETLEKHAKDLSIAQPKSLFDALMLSYSPGLSVENLDCAGLTQKIVKHFRASIPIDALKRVRETRDKILAHNEAIDTAKHNLTTWGDANALVDYAKRFVIAIGGGYMDKSLLSYSVNEGKGTDIPMRHLIESLGLHKN